jgi:hypothetical protein
MITRTIMNKKINKMVTNTKIQMTKKTAMANSVVKYNIEVEDGYESVDYSEFDYEFDTFMDRTYKFEEHYPGFLKDSYAVVYDIVKNELDHLDNVSVSVDIPESIHEYLFDIISIFMDCEKRHCENLFLILARTTAKKLKHF